MKLLHMDIAISDQGPRSDFTIGGGGGGEAGVEISKVAGKPRTFLGGLRTSSRLLPTHTHTHNFEN